MDKIRELRYLTPPIFFLGFLLTGGYFSGQWTLADFEAHAAVFSAALVASVFPLGFTIQSMSINLQRLLFNRNKQYYFAFFEDYTWKGIARAMHLHVDLLRRYPAPASIWQFEKWNKDVIDSTIRLWTAFNIAAGSIVAISLASVALLAMRIGEYLSIPWIWGWGLCALLLITLFLRSAWCTWKEHMQAFEIQALRLDDEGQMPDERKRDHEAQA